MSTAKNCPPLALSPATVRAYAGDWALFTDWCAGTGHQQLPADPATVTRFLTDNPAAASTLRRRVAAIQHRHTATGYAPPGRSDTVLAALGRRTGEPRDTPTSTTIAVEAALRALPSHGWTQGMFGRRDRCLLVMSQLAGVPYKHLAVLTAGMVTIAGGVASISVAGPVTLTATDDPVLCGPCAVARWLRVLDAVMTKPSKRVLAQQIDEADAVTDQSPHLCRSTREISALTLDVPLLPPIDQWGYVPFPLQRLTPHSLSQLVRSMLAGDLVVHRHIPVDDEPPEPEQPTPAPVEVRRVYSREDAQRAWARRRADLEDIAGIDEVLAQIDARAKELERRTAAVLAQNIPATEQGKT